MVVQARLRGWQVEDRRQDICRSPGTCGELFEEWEGRSGESLRRVAGWEFRTEQGGAGGEGRTGSHIYCLPEVIAIPTGGMVTWKSTTS